MIEEFEVKDNGNYRYTTDLGGRLTIYQCKDETGFKTGYWSWVVESNDGKRKKFAVKEEWDVECAIIDAVVSIPIAKLEELYKEEIGL